MNKEFFNTTSINILLTFLLGITISYIDLHNDEVQPTVGLLLLFSFIMGNKHPQKAWVYSIILGLSIFFGYVFANMTGFIPKGTQPSNILWSLIAVIPAFVGGYSGVAFKHFFRKHAGTKSWET